MDPELKRQLEDNAALVIERLGPGTDFEFGYNERSVEWLDAFINRQRAREDFSINLAKGLANTIGSFLGECIIKNYGGAWGQTENGLGVVFDDKNAAYPISKVSKHLENGEGDSLYSFYTLIPLMIPHLQ